jgi:predicted ATPase
LDWSYRLLSALEQSALRRLAVFGGPFDLKSAVVVVADEAADAGAVFKTLIRLAGKSLLVADHSGERILYRLLDTTRAYALEKLCESGELAAIRTRHARTWSTAETNGWAWHALTPDGGALLDKGFLAHVEGLAAGIPTVAEQAAGMLRAGAAEPAPGTEALLREALAAVHCHDALLWELRIATHLARLLGTRGERQHDAHELLVGVCRRYTEIFQSADFVAAEELLLDLCDGLSVAGTSGERRR